MGTFAYGTSYYSLRAFDQTTGVVQDASATCAATATPSVTGGAIVSASGQVNALASSSATGGYVYESSGTVVGVLGVTSAGEVVKLGDSAITPTSTGSADFIRIREVDAQADAVSVNSCTAVYSILVSVGFSAQSGVDVAATRVRESNAIASSDTESTASGRYKYLVAGTDNETWTEVSATTPTWTPVDSDSEIWTEVA